MSDPPGGSDGGTANHQIILFFTIIPNNDTSISHPP